MLDARDQPEIGRAPYDSWRTADGFDDSAQFHRQPDGSYLVRFPGQADFSIDLAASAVRCVPASEDQLDAAQSLFHNAIQPLIGNHLGGLFLHGSAVSLASGAGAIAFLGDSRRGKTTLAGGFAKAGHPFLTEDTVELQPSGGRYAVQPTRPVLRLFSDSAHHLLGEAGALAKSSTKSALEAGQHLPFAARPEHLRAIYFLGPGESSGVSIERLASPAALAEVMRHAFILDVGDKPRLRGHFQRLGELAGQIPCYSLDFPRIYEQLTQVIQQVADHASNGPEPHEV
jgi:hypothetical protein